MTPRYRAEHVGSLLRPPELLEARAAKAAGRMSQKQLQEMEDLAIRAAIKKQRQIGLDILSDGEMRRASWLTDMAEAVDGFVSEHVMLEWKGPGGGMEGSSAHAVGSKLHKVRKLTALELPLLQQAAPGKFKVTLPAPSNFMVSSYKKGITDRVYPSHADLLRDIVAILRDEVQWLVAEGASYIQMDAPYYSHYLDPQQRDAMKKVGFDPDRELENAIAGDNAAIAGCPDDVTTALHICRGNSRSRWYTEGGYDVIAEKLFGRMNTGTFLLEYDSDRSGGFEPLRAVPKGKNVVLGLVTTKEAKLESMDDLRRRIEDAAKFIPLDNLAISPQCGFASVAAGNLLSEDDQWRKLELVVNTARKVWG